MAKVIKREESLEVRVGLAHDDREPITKELLEELAEIDKLRIEAAQTAATYRKTINDHTEKAVELRTTLEQGRPEMKDVIVHYNFGKGRVKYELAEREDTDGPLVGTGKFLKDKERDVTDEDLQLKIGDSEGADEGKDGQEGSNRDV